MKKKEKIEGFKISYRSFLMLIFLALGIITLSFTIMQSFSRASEYILTNAKQAYLERLSQTNKVFADNLSQLGSITGYLGSTDDMISWMKQYDDSVGGTRSTIQKSISDACTKAMIFNKYIDGIVVVTEDETIYVATRDFAKDKFSNMKNDLMGNGDYYEINAEKSVVFFLPQNKDENTGDMTMLEYLKSRYFFFVPVGEGKDEYGGIFVILNQTIFDDITESDTQTTEKYLITNQNNDLIIKSKYVSEEDFITVKNGLDTIDGNAINSEKTTNFNKLMIYSMESGLFGWKMVLFHNEALIDENLSILRLLFLGASGFIIIMLVVFYAVISKKITLPIRKLVDFIRGYNLNEGREYEIVKEKTGFQLKILYIMIVVILIPNLILTVFSQFYTSKIVKDYIIKSNKNLFQYTAKRMDKLMLDKKTILSAISFNQNVQQLFDAESETDESELADLVDEYLLLGSGRDEVIIFDEHDNSIYSDYVFYDEPALSFSDIAQIKDYSIWGETRVSRFKVPEIELYIKINQLTTLKTLGYIVSRIKEADVENIFKEMSDSRVNVFVIDAENKILSHADKNLIGREIPLDEYELKDGVLYADESFAFIIPLENTPWHLVGIFDEDVFYKDINQSLVEKIYLFGIMVAVVLLLSYIIANNTTRYLRRMYALMGKCEIDSLEAVFPEESKIIEISELGSAFNDMITRTEILLDKLLIYNKKQKELENRKREAEFIALQTQINPHFLYNTFECINWMIKCGEKESAVNMVTALSNMLHFVAKTENMIVSIEKELDYTKTYIEIMAIKFRSDITFKLDIDDEILKYKTIKLLLQPIVENSVRHGIGYTEGAKGTISISCIEEADCLKFTISDDGKGIKEQEIAKLNQELESGIHYDRVGLYNVQNRIWLFFGDRYGIKVMANKEKGVRVEAKIPKIERIEDFESGKKSRSASTIYKPSIWESL